MLSAVRKFVRQCPLAAIGICTLLGTGATAALVLDTYPPELAREHKAAEAKHRARAAKPMPPVPALDDHEPELIGP